MILSPSFKHGLTVRMQTDVLDVLLRTRTNGNYHVADARGIARIIGEGKKVNRMSDKDTIYRQEAIDAINAYLGLSSVSRTIQNMTSIQEILENLPSAEPEKEISRRVLWSGWKGTRYTRYKCPNCNKPVKNDDVYCHRCGQKLMFPHISHTPYIEGQKQELIVRWDDEE